jgi:hypothetical protein
MTQSPAPEPPVPAKISEATFEPVGAADKEHGRFWDDGDDAHTLRPVSFSGRMFNVGWKGWVRLALVCIFVGAVFQAGGFNPFAPGFTLSIGAGQIITGVLNIAGWAAQLGAMPLVLGAIAVLPFWLIWRAILALFNKDRPPGPDDRILPKDRPRKKR